MVINFLVVLEEVYKSGLDRRVTLYFYHLSIPLVTVSVLLVIDCSLAGKSILFLATFWVAGFFGILHDILVVAFILSLSWGFLCFITTLPCPNLGLFSIVFLIFRINFCFWGNKFVSSIFFAPWTSDNFTLLDFFCKCMCTKYLSLFQFYNISHAVCYAYWRKLEWYQVDHYCHVSVFK